MMTHNKWLRDMLLIKTKSIQDDIDELYEEKARLKKKSDQRSVQKLIDQKKRVLRWKEKELAEAEYQVDQDDLREAMRGEYADKRMYNV